MIEKCENTLLKQRSENLCTTLQLKSQQEKATICTFAHSHICTLTTHLHITHTLNISMPLPPQSQLHVPSRQYGQALRGWLYANQGQVSHGRWCRP